MSFSLSGLVAVAVGAAGHLFGGGHENGAVLLVYRGKGVRQFPEVNARFSVGAPVFATVRELRQRHVGSFGLLVEELVQRHFERGRDLLQRFDRWDGDAILDAREVAAEKAGAPFNIALGEMFGFADSSESVCDVHGMPLARIKAISQDSHKFLGIPAGFWIVLPDFGASRRFSAGNFSVIPRYLAP